MNTPESLNRMVSRLIRRGLPVNYATRAAAEFADHHHDLVEELQASGFSESQASTEASRRLGNARTLAKKTVREYQRRYWCGRWPMLTFLLGPIPLLLLTWIATWLALICIGWPLYKLGLFGDLQADGTITTKEWLVTQFLVALLLFVTPAITMLGLARLAKRAALGWKWIAVSACVLGLTIGMFHLGFPNRQWNMRIDGKPAPADQPLLTVGAPVFAQTWLAAWRWYTRDQQQICQVLLPLAITAAAILRAKQLSLRSQRLFVDVS